MDILNVFSILFFLAALFNYINYRFIKLPQTIGLLIVSLLLSMILIVLGNSFPSLHIFFSGVINEIRFDEALLRGMLGFLLFAGALHINLNDLLKQKVIISILATFGVFISTLLIGTSVYYILGYIGADIGFIYCLIFGAIISPTDPIAVLGILKMVKAPKSLETKIAGESLFNDGVGVVIFAVLIDIAIQGQGGMELSTICIHFIKEAVGGIVFGLIIGSVIYVLLRSVDDYSIEIMLTVALVLGGSAISNILHISGPLAMVVAGLLIGNRGRLYAMSEKTHSQLFSFWELIDEFLNAILFFMIGFVLISIDLKLEIILLGIIAIPLVLLIRLVCIYMPVTILKRSYDFSRGAIQVMTWGGLRGGISVALALSLKGAGIDPYISDGIITVTYIVVVFSIVVQGLTIGPLIKKML